MAGDEPQVLLKACMDAMIDPQVLIEAVRDPRGGVVDFIVRSANRAALSYLRSTDDQLNGGGVSKILSSHQAPGLLSRFARCLVDGEPVSIDDFPYFSETLGELRRYDIRAARAGADLLAMTWSDVTGRSQFVERIAVSERKFRRSMDNAAVGMCLITPEGRFEDVNDALAEFLGYDADTLMKKTWQELTAPGYLDEDFENVNAVLEGRLDSYRGLKQYIHADGHLIWGDLSVGCLRDEEGRVQYLISQITDVTAQVEADERHRVLAEELERQKDRIAASETTYRLLAENAGDLVCQTREDGNGANRVVWVSPNVQTVLGAPPEYWVGRRLREFVLPEDAQSHSARWQKVSAGGAVSQRVRMVSADGTPHWFHARIKPFYDAEGRRDGAVVAAHLVDDEVAADQAVEQARRAQARADERYRRSMKYAAVGMCLVTPGGRFEEVNEALCRLLGYDADTLTQKTWQELTVQEYMEEDQQNVDDLLEGRRDSFRMVKEYLHADGHRIWGDLSVSCIRDENGQVENFISQIIDITAQVEANDRVRVLAEQLQQRTDQVSEELGNAATYMTSILPRGLTGAVDVSSRYLPARELGGDIFDYRWIDDDHLAVYLIDVSGHGLPPALLSASIHNMLRFGNLAPASLLEPDTVLTELNRRFQMDQHGYHYFTMWYGVDAPSSRILRYSSAGSPPALAFNPVIGTTVAATELATTSAPVGMFADTAFTLRSYTVPPGSQILIHSDGASEITLADDRQLSLKDFKNLVGRLAQSPPWSLDGLIEELHTLAQSSVFEDDCSLIQLTFPRNAEQGRGATQVEIDGFRDPLAAVQAALDAFWSINPHVPEDVRLQMAIAAAEVGANIVEHTGRGKPLRILMDTFLVDDQVHVDFTDDGPPVAIDLASVTMPDLMAERGRGLAMAQALLGQLAYRCDETGNRWMLVGKRFEGPGGEGLDVLGDR